MLRPIFAFFFNEIIDTITQHIQTRFSDFVKIWFLDLLGSSKYRKYQKTFPEESFKCLLDTYGFACDEILLKNQLIFLYSQVEFQEKSPTEMQQFFSNIPASKTALSQVYLLCSLITVIPVSISCVERSFSSLKRIKSFSRNKMGQDRLSDLGLISIESQLQTEVIETKSFQDAVITKFTSGERRMEFFFKWLFCFHSNSETLPILVLCPL